MPVYEFSCISCHNTVERYFPSLDKSPEFMQCGDGAAERREVRGCGGMMRKIASVPAIETFKPFTTRNLDPSGAVTHIHSKSQLQRLMKQHGVREASVNHNMYGGDVRSVPLNPDLPSKVNPMRKRKEAKRITVDEAKAIQAQAERTDLGRRRA